MYNLPMYTSNINQHVAVEPVATCVIRTPMSKSIAVVLIIKAL